jgi:hypothetical protein
MLEDAFQMFTRLISVFNGGVFQTQFPVRVEMVEELVGSVAISVYAEGMFYETPCSYDGLDGDSTL